MGEYLFVTLTVNRLDSLKLDQLWKTRGENAGENTTEEEAASAEEEDEDTEE